jgi:hypothetical protein
VSLIYKNFSVQRLIDAISVGAPFQRNVTAVPSHSTVNDLFSARFSS